MTEASMKGLKQTLGVVRSTGKAAYAFKTSEHTEVEVGDPEAEEFTPKLALYKWNREVHLKLYPSMRLTTIQSGQDPQNRSSAKQNAAAPTARLDKNQIKHSTGPVDYRFYSLDPAEQMEEGGVEFEFTLNEKPDSNVFVFPIETRNLVFYYQPELTAEEKAHGFHRPENVVGSYAVYHALKGNVHPSDVIAQKYKTGKAFHIYRPKATDADGNSVWAELQVDAEHGTLTVTVDQAFLDDAAYPVVVDPTFGYTACGLSNYDYANNNIVGGLFTTPPGASNAATKITAYLQTSGASCIKCGFYKDSDRSFLQGTVELTNPSPIGGWIDFAFSPNYTLPDTVTVDMCVWANASTKAYYDSVSGQTVKEKTQTYGSWPDPIPSGWTVIYSNMELSIYCTYNGSVPLTIDASSYGVTSPTAGIHSYTLGQTVPVTATPNDSNHMLSVWLVDGVNVGSANPYTITMDTSHTLTPCFLATTLGIALTDLDALVTWAAPAHDPANGIGIFFFGTLLGHYGVADLLAEATYQNSLATWMGYISALKICRTAIVRGIPNAGTVTQQKAAMNALAFFAGKHWPITGTYNMGYGAENTCFHDYYYSFSDAFQLSTLLNYLPTKWNHHLAWQELMAVCQAAGGKGILCMSPINLHYYSVDRFYDENALTINSLVELYMLDPDNNAASLAYALTLWSHINTAMWSTDHYNYRPTWPGFECEGGFFPQVIMKLYAANGYALTNFDRMLTDLHTRFLASGWAAPQWNYASTCYYVVVHMPGSNSQRRLQNTLGAWVTLHAFYPALPAADQTAIVNLLNAATPAWKHLFLDSTLYIR